MSSQESEFAGYELSGWWKRVAAYLLDGLFLLFLYLLLFLLLFLLALLVGSDAFYILLIVLAFLLLILVQVFYYGYSMKREGERNGQSPGKQLMSIRVLREDGVDIDFSYAVKRQVLVLWLLFGVVFNFFTSGIVTLIDYLWPLWDEKRQALHDKMVSSRVVLARDS